MVLFIIIIAGAAVLICLQKIPAYAPASQNAGRTANAPMPGSDRDAHGCIGSAGYSWCPIKQKCLRIWEESCSITAHFVCDAKKSITSTFDYIPADQVELILSDGTTATLPHAISADGARYANSDESFVFWNKGDTAFIQQNGKETYSNCVVSKK